MGFPGGATGKEPTLSVRETEEEKINNKLERAHTERQEEEVVQTS